MPAIRAEALARTFRVLRAKETGGRVTGPLGRSYQTVAALDGVSFEVPDGQIVGYLGPNGAGKSTTIKIITGVLRPSGGTVSVLGLDPFRQRQLLCTQIGVLFGQRSQLWWDIPLVESFVALRYIYGLRAGDFKAQMGLLCDLLELDSFLNTPVRQLSLGQRMRGEIAAILLHHPRILFLDEPTIGVDAVAKAKLRSFLLAINRNEGTTILFTSHDLGDIESVAERVLLLYQGRLMADGSPQQIAKRFGVRPILSLHLPPSELDWIGVVSALLPSHCNVSRREEGGVSIAFDRSEITPPQILSRLGELPILDFGLEEASLTHAFLKAYAQTS